MKKDNPRERRAWSLMRYRCNTKTSPDYPNYGGRGIRVHEGWECFDNFFADMGQIPAGKNTLDRLDVNGNYEPGNCRWLSRAEQAQNKRTSKMVSLNGEKMCLAEAARRTRLRASTIRERLKRGWSEVEALTTRAMPGGLRCR